MHTHLVQDGSQCTHTELRVQWDGEMMLAVLMRRKTEVAAGLAGYDRAEHAQC
jgi:hypothetical protein